jgi:hypothetical protein
MSFDEPHPSTERSSSTRLSMSGQTEQKGLPCIVKQYTALLRMLLACIRCYIKPVPRYEFLILVLNIRHSI